MLGRGILENEIKRFIGNRVRISTDAVFGDFLWDTNMSLAEIVTLDLAVFVDGRTNERRIVLQRIRNELRYWLTTNRDPTAASPVQNELGTLASLEDAVALCDEFAVAEVGVEDLKTRRSAGRLKLIPDTED